MDPDINELKQAILDALNSTLEIGDVRDVVDETISEWLEDA